MKHNYLNVSLPVHFEGVLNLLKDAYKKEKDVNVSKGETVGLAIVNECKRLGIRSK